MKTHFKPQTILVLLAATATLQASGTVTNFTGATSDRFGIAGNWDNGIPAAGMTGNVAGRRVEIPTQNEMVVGATLNFNGASSLERNNTAQAAFSGVVNINDTTNVKISSWWPENNSVLNWNSSGTFSLAPAGPTNQSRFYIQGGRPGAVVNINKGFWDLRGDTGGFSMRIFSGTVNVNGGLLLADYPINLGAGFISSSGYMNYSRHAEIRAQKVGVFVASILNFESGATLYVESGLLGPFGDEGLTWLRDMLRLTEDRGIHIDGVRQSIGPTQGLESSNFITSTVEIEGIWYNALMAMGERAVISQNGTHWILSMPGKRGFAYQARTSVTLDGDPATWAAAGAPVQGAGAPLEIQLGKDAFPADPGRFFTVEISAVPAF